MDIYRQRSEFGSGDAFGDMWTRPDPEPAELHDIYSYALTVDGYAYALAVYRRELPGLARELERRWLGEQRKPLTFAELRLLLFWWQRGAHWQPAAVSEAESDRVHRLHRALCEAWEQEWPRAQAPAVRDPGPRPKRRPQPAFRTCPYCQRESEDPVYVKHRFCPWCREFYDHAGLQLHEDRARCPEGAEWWVTLGRVPLAAEEQRIARIEALRESTAEGRGESAFDQEGDEMTRADGREDVCAVCGQESTHDHLLSVSGGGERDLDGRASGRLRLVIQWLVHRCPFCGYCAADISEAPARAGYVVASGPYRQQLGDPSMPYLAQSLLCSAMIAEVDRSSPFNKVVERRLEAAWACDDAGHEAAASVCRLAAAAALEGLNRMGGRYHENDLRADHALLADLYRRAGRFPEADANVQWANDIIPGDPVGWTRCLELQQALTEARDTGVHTIAEASERPASASVVAGAHQSRPTHGGVATTDDGQPASLSAVDLLRQFVDLRDYEPDLESWSEEGFAANPPRLYRLRRLRALFAAYGIDWDPAGFTQGAFIESSDERYADVAKRMDVRLVTAGVEPGSLSGLGASQRQQCFKMLLRYREHIQKVLVFPDRILAASGWLSLAYRQMRELNRVLAGQLPLVEDVLTALISPEGRRFELLELVRRYGYPDVDLKEIDIDWI